MVPSDGRSIMKKTASVSLGRLVPLPPSHQEAARLSSLLQLVSQGAMLTLGMDKDWGPSR